MDILSFFKKLKKKFLRYKLLFKALLENKKIIYLNNYSNYSDYLKHQKNKTTNPKKIKIWLEDEWNIKYYGFSEIFKRNKKYVFKKKNALCLGSRTGQEVKALIDLGIDAKGIDLVPFPPYTIEGDIHNIKKDENSVELIFTNIIDHSLYPEKFCSEMERICKPGGHIIIHIQKGIDGDCYSENMISNPKVLVNLFKLCKLSEDRPIKNSFDLMNWEIILKKNNVL